MGRRKLALRLTEFFKLPLGQARAQRWGARVRRANHPNAKLSHAQIGSSANVFCHPHYGQRWQIPFRPPTQNGVRLDTSRAVRRVGALASIHARGLYRNPIRRFKFLVSRHHGALEQEGTINNGQPTLHALCISALSIQEGEAIVHIGAGSGYYTALLYVNAGATGPVQSWLDALRIGGRLLFPLTGAGNLGAMLLIKRRSGDQLEARFLCRAAFIPCTGARDEELEQSLSDAFQKDTASVRSLRLDTSPDESCWFRGTNWWLSTAAVP